MFILLPQEHKSFLIKQYRIRFTIVTLFLFIGLILTALALLVPSYFIAKSEHSEIETEKKSIEKS